MMTPEHYFEYLQRRSWLGWWYRKYWLYPRLCRQLAGHTLDVGCGIGDFLRHRPGTVGVDINPLTVDWCQRQGLDARLMVPDRLPFEAASFDSAILDNVLEHLAQPESLLGEIHRVLRPQGILVVGVPGKRGYASDPDHKTYHDEGSLIATLSRAGYGVRCLFHMPLCSQWLNARMRQYCLYGVFHRG